MVYSEIEKKRFMSEALKEGLKALPVCLPNPPVGCVLVKNKQIISKGYTQKPGHYHAEVMAIHSIQGTLNKMDLFVTLEPCSFHGKTPSCAKTLILRKIRSVYISIVDPHEKNQGKGIEMLQNAGIYIEVGTLKEQAMQHLKPYLFNK